MRFLSTPKLLIIDELGYLPMPAEDAATLFQVIGRYGKGSIILTTNLGVASWGEIFADHTIAAAMLDRLLHKSVVFTITGDSYRLRSNQAQARKHRRAAVLVKAALGLTGWGKGFPQWLRRCVFRCAKARGWRRCAFGG